MIFPYRIDTLFKHYPIANWVIIALTVLAYGLLIGDGLSRETVEAMVLDGWSPAGLLGHVFLHADILPLTGNMVFLWVFGNAVCGNTSNAAYPFIYAGLALAAAITHLVFDGEPVIGASGAINGVVGMALAMYPLNRVVFGFFWGRVGTFQIPLWGLAVVWLLFDLYGVLMHGEGVAYWAHLGGFFAGLAAGYAALRMRWVKLAEVDHRSLEEIFTGKTAEERRARLRAEEAAENGDADAAESALAPVLRKNAGPWAQQAAAAGDPLVMPVTAPMVAGWSKAVSATVVSAVDAAVIEAGGAEGERRKFELLYGASFLAMGYSFHRSLADYYRRVAGARIWPHDGPALAELLRMIEADFVAMRACAFVDEELAGLRDETRLAEFLRVAAVKKSVSA